MKADEMALECARQLKAYCGAHEHCSDCIFDKMIFCERIPEQWDIPETIGNKSDDDLK